MARRPIQDDKPVKLLDTRAAAAFLGVKVAAPRMWRYNGTGPAYEVFWGGQIRYRMDELERYKAEMAEKKARRVKVTPAKSAARD